MTNGGEIVEIKHLEHFTAVVESESFTRAAIRQQVSQPSITLAVQRLEDELGVQLVDRRYKKLTLTEDGKRFYDRTQVILKEVQITVDEMRKNQDVTAGRIRVAMPSSIGGQVYRMFLSVFNDRFPSLGIQIEETGDQSAARQVEEEQVDVGIVFLPEVSREIEVLPLARQRVVLAVPKSHPLAQEKGPIAFSRLRNEPFIMPEEQACFHQLAIQECLNQGFKPNIILKTPQVHTIRQLIQDGFGLSFLLESLVDEADGLVGIELKPQVYADVGLAWKRGKKQPQAVKGFIELFENQRIELPGSLGIRPTNEILMGIGATRGRPIG